MWISYNDILEYNYDLGNEVILFSFYRKLFVVYSNKGTLLDLEAMHT